MKAEITFFTGMVAGIVGLAMRSCDSTMNAELARSWCGRELPAMVSHAHCAGCAVLAAGFVLMIAGIVVGARPERRLARGHI